MGLRTSGCCHCRWATKQTAAAQENTAEYEYENWEMGMENGKRGWARLLLFIHTKLPAAKSLMPVGLQNPLRKLIQSVPLRPEMQPAAVAYFAAQTKPIPVAADRPRPLTIYVARQ